MAIIIKDKQEMTSSVTENHYTGTAVKDS